LDTVGGDCKGVWFMYTEEVFDKVKAKLKRTSKKP
jgi:hypothetical protein